MPKNLGLYNNDLSVPRKKDLNALETRIKTNEDDIAMAQSDIEGLSSDVGTLQTDVGQVKTALGSKQDTIVGGASTITEDNLTADKALVSNASGKVAVSEVTATELGTLTGMTTNVATAIAAKADQTALNGVRYQLAAKADQSAVDALRNQVNTKASQSALNTLNKQVQTLNTDFDTLEAEFYNSLNGGISTVFSTESSYATDDYVWYNNQLYQAKQEVLAGEWNSNAWNKIVVAEELKKIPNLYIVNTSTTFEEAATGWRTDKELLFLSRGDIGFFTGQTVTDGVVQSYNFVVFYHTDVNSNHNIQLVFYTLSKDGWTISDYVGLNLAGKKLSGVGFPSANYDATNKEYVDSKIPTKTSQLTNDSNYITIAEAPVTSVNAKTGEVTLTASDVGALPVTGGTMSGVLSAQSNTSYTTAQARNIIMSTEVPSGGQPGEIWIRYSN